MSHKQLQRLFHSPVLFSYSLQIQIHYACLITVNCANSNVSPEQTYSHFSVFFFLQNKCRAGDHDGWRCFLYDSLLRQKKKKTCFYLNYSHYKFTVIIQTFCFVSLCYLSCFMSHLPLFPSPLPLLLLLPARLSYSGRRTCSTRSVRRESASSPATGKRLRSARPRQKKSTEG